MTIWGFLENPRKTNLDKTNCISLMIQGNGERSAARLQEAMWAGRGGMDPEVWQPWTESRHPGFGHLKFQAPQDLCFSCPLETRPPGCQVSRDAWIGLFAGRELLPRCQTGHVGTSSVSQTGRKEPNLRAFVWNLVNFGKWTFSDGEKKSSD